MNSNSLLRSAKPKKHLLLFVFLVYITHCPCLQLVWPPTAELMLFSTGNLYCFDMCQLAVSSCINEETREDFSIFMHFFLHVFFFCSSFLFCLCFGVLLDGGLLIASLYMTRHLNVGTSFYILNLSDSLASVV